MIEYVKLKFESRQDYDRAASINGGILVRKNYHPPFSPEMYVRAEDADELQQELSVHSVPYELIEP